MPNRDVLNLFKENIMEIYTTGGLYTSYVSLEKSQWRK